MIAEEGVAVGTSSYIVSKSGVESLLKWDTEKGFTDAIPNIMSALFPDSRYLYKISVTIISTSVIIISVIISVTSILQISTTISINQPTNQQVCFVSDGFPSSRRH